MFFNNCVIAKSGDYLVFVKEGVIIPDYVKTIGQRVLILEKSITFLKSAEEIEKLVCADCYFL